MKSETDDDNNRNQDDPLPSREQLALLAASLKRKKASDAVKDALALWDEAGLALAHRKRNSDRRGLENIGLPKKFPASLDDFLHLVVQAKTVADATKRFRDFYRDTLWDHPALPELPSRPYSSERRDEGAGPVDPEKWAAGAIQGWKDCGFTDERQWVSLAFRYLNWWKQQKSLKARTSAGVNRRSA